MNAHVRWRLVFAAVLGTALLVLPAIASSETSPTVEANNACSPGHCWKPPGTAINTGGSVNIANPTSVPHGVEWKSGPATPSCTEKVPVGTTPAASGTNWSGSCTFTQPGTYVFWCTVHGKEMTETINVGSGPPAPTVAKLAPKKGPAAGGTPVTITGTNFTGATAVTFGTTAAKELKVSSATSIMALSPAHLTGIVDVRVTTPGGPSAVSKHDRFKFTRH